MPKREVAPTPDTLRVARVDDLVSRERFKNRSQAVETARGEKLDRLDGARLARECAELDRAEEQRLADEGLGEIVG